jgi:hypothetical protein
MKAEIRARKGQNKWLFRHAASDADRRGHPRLGIPPEAVAVLRPYFEGTAKFLQNS